MNFFFFLSLSLSLSYRTLFWLSHLCLFSRYKSTVTTLEFSPSLFLKKENYKKDTINNEFTSIKLYLELNFTFVIPLSVLPLPISISLTPLLLT